MRRLSALVAVVLAVGLSLAAPPEEATALVTEEPTLWLTDDVTRTTYNVSLTGGLISSFPTPNTAISSIAVDPINRTLWGANEGSASGIPPGKLVNYDRTGVVIQEILASAFGGIGTEGMAVTIAADDSSLWVVDDPAITGPVPTVYNITRTGVLISSFPTSSFDPASTSPQAIAYDPFGGTLWIADNQAERVYQITQTGTLIRSFPTNAGPFVTAAHPFGVRNVQGITVESSDVLWLTARDTGTIYRVTKDGATVLSSFAMSSVDPVASNPTGVAFDGPPGISLGAAASYGVLALPGGKVKLKDLDKSTGVVADVALGPNAVQDFSEGLLSGTLFVDPSANNAKNHSVIITGGTTQVVLSGAVGDALAVAGSAAALAPNQTFDKLDKSTTLTGGPGVNVVEVNKIELDKGRTLTLSGGPTTTFILNVGEKVRLKDGSAIVVKGGMDPGNVLYNLLGTDESSVEEGSAATGTFLAPASNVKVKGQRSLVTGGIISGREIKFEDGGRLRSFDDALAPGDLGEAANAAVLGLTKSKVELKGSASTVVGDVLLGPLAKEEFSAGTITGTYFVDPLADDKGGGGVTVTGGVVEAQLSRQVADAVDAAGIAGRMTPTQTFDEIKSSQTITAGSALTIVRVKKVDLDEGKTLTLHGDASTIFVINVSESLKLKEGASIVLSGGVSPNNVMWNLLGNKEAAIESGAGLTGTVLGLQADKLEVKGTGSTVVGALIGGGDVKIEEGGKVTGA